MNRYFPNERYAYTLRAAHYSHNPDMKHSPRITGSWHAANHPRKEPWEFDESVEGGRGWERSEEGRPEVAPWCARVVPLGDKNGSQRALGLSACGGALGVEGRDVRKL